MSIDDKTTELKHTCSSSLGGHTATVFGATGFLGRYIVNRLGIVKVNPHHNSICLIGNSKKWMYSRGTLSGRDGEETLEGLRGSGASGFPGWLL